MDKGFPGGGLCPTLSSRFGACPRWCRCSWTAGSPGVGCRPVGQWSRLLADGELAPDLSMVGLLASVDPHALDGRGPGRPDPGLGPGGGDGRRPQAGSRWPRWSTRPRAPGWTAEEARHRDRRRAAAVPSHGRRADPGRRSSWAPAARRRWLRCRPGTSPTCRPRTWPTRSASCPMRRPPRCRPGCWPGAGADAGRVQAGRRPGGAGRRPGLGRRPARRRPPRPAGSSGSRSRRA